MRRGNYSNNQSGGLGTLLVGALVGAAAVVLSDERLRNKTLDFIERKKDETKQGIENVKEKSSEKAREVTDKALNVADEKLGQARSKVRGKKQERAEMDEKIS